MARTPKARALGNALRQARNVNGLTVRAFAKQIGRDPAIISRWENGEYYPKPETVAQVLAELGVRGNEFDEIMTLAYNTDAPLWVATKLPERNRQMMALLDCEDNASKIIDVTPLLMPGLLQTKNYIRAVMVGAHVPEGEIASRVKLRIGRQTILEPPEPVPYVAVVSHFALTHIIGSQAIMTEQLRHVLTMAERPTIEVRVIRPDSGWNPALEGHFCVMELKNAKPIVALENRRSGMFLHEHDDVGSYQLAADMALEASMAQDQSMAHIANIIKRMERTT